LFPSTITIALPIVNRANVTLSPSQDELMYNQQRQHFSAIRGE
jgi:hypothetical protein